MGSPVNIVVLVKQVPDTAVERKLEDADGTLDRASVDGAHQRARRVRDRGGPEDRRGPAGGWERAEVTIVTMGPQKAAESIRKALSMGADKAVHLLDDGLAGSIAMDRAL
jgi:electron transfer flavoprotein beta subunit